MMLFIKYISDKYADVPYAPITIPRGASFKDMVALKGKPDIGDKINTKIIAPLAKINKLSDMPDFNDTTKLGDGKEKVERPTYLIAIFDNPGQAEALGSHPAVLWKLQNHRKFLGLSKHD